MKQNIENFLSRFTKDATSWSKATDEIRDLARESREYLEDMEDVIVEPLNFREFKTPAEWNTKARNYILANFDRMKPETQKAYYERFREWFESTPSVLEEENQKPWAMRLADNTIEYFDTNEEMVAYSVQPDVDYKMMGATKFIVK